MGRAKRPPRRKIRCTSGPLEGIPWFLVLPSEQLRTWGWGVLEDSSFWEQIGRLWYIAMNPLTVTSEDPERISPRAIASMTEQQADYWFRDEIGQDDGQDDRAKAASEELERVAEILRPRKPRRNRDVRAAVMDLRLREQGLSAPKRRSSISAKLGIPLSAVPMALSRSRDQACLPKPPRK